MRKKILFIYNPRAGKGLIQQKLSDIFAVFAEQNCDILVHPTLAAGDAQEFAESHAAQADMIVCSGGDGTMDEVVTGVMHGCPACPIGYIPAGSTNDFANSLGISKDMVQAARDIMEGEIYHCDIGTFNENVFIYIAAFGLFTDVSYETDQVLKNTLGHFAYLLEAGKRMLHIPSYQMRIETEEKQIEGEFSYGMITNARSVGGMRNITGTSVDMNDGLFEVTLVRTPKNPLDLSDIFATLLSEDNRRSPLVCKFKTKALKLYSEEEIKWTLDGEFGGNHKEVEINNEQKVLKLLLNRGKA